jgi:hypothetical protein
MRWQQLLGSAAARWVTPIFLFLVLVAAGPAAPPAQSAPADPAPADLSRILAATPDDPAPAEAPACVDEALAGSTAGLMPTPQPRAACCTGPDKQECRNFCAAQRCAHGSTFCLDGQCACECQGCLPA